MLSVILFVAVFGLTVAAPPVRAGNIEGLETLSSHLISGGPGKDGIPAMTNPLFVDPSEVSYVTKGALVLGTAAVRLAGVTAVWWTVEGWGFK